MRYLRRTVWYIAKRLLVFALIFSLGIVTFYYAMNLANIQIILKDGMAARAEVVIMGEDDERLSKYFQSSFLQNDAVIQTVSNGTSPYQDYKVTGIDHRINMSFAWLWPWDEKVRVEITESVPHIDGRVKSNRAEALIAEKGSSAVYPPAWQSARYRVSLIKDNGQWLIASVNWLADVEE